MSSMNRSWEFRVNCPTDPGETVCVSGDCSRLGNWKHNLPFLLQRDTSKGDESDIWTGVAALPFRNVKFRYFVCMILDNPNPGSGTVHVVRRWETHLEPRLIRKDEQRDAVRANDIFGEHLGVHRVETGWLTAETVIQFKISNGPINFWRKKHKNANNINANKVQTLTTPYTELHLPASEAIRLKLVPKHLSKQNSISEFPEPNSRDHHDSASSHHDMNPNWPVIEVAAINETEHQFSIQEQFGRLYRDNEILVFQAQVLLLETVAYMIDFYMDVPNDPVPQHVGFCHILPGNIRDSSGTIVQPISSMRQDPIGQISIEYVVIRPLKNCPCDLSVSFCKHWKHAWTGLDIGHRGSGTSHNNKVKNCANVRENTIASLQQATNHGADFVEFDVQLSKDLIPVLFHDFHVNIGLHQKAKQGGRLTHLRIPVKDLTLAQLHELKIILEDGCISHCQISHESEEAHTEENLESDHHEPFPTLQLALETLETHVGFNVEIKWTMQLKDGSYELNNPFELNLFIDIVLDVVLKYAGKRRIVFSCFHPDICVMLRLKQNKYPVLFLTQGVTSKYPEYNDPRTQNTPVAINFALLAGILGINIHAEDVLRDPSLVKTALSHGLITFCWGEDNNNIATIKYLKELGIHGIIYDRIEEHIEQKESVFLSDDGNDLLQIAACLSPSSPEFGTEESYHQFSGDDGGDDLNLNGNGNHRDDSALDSANNREIPDANSRSFGLGLFGR